MLSKSDIEYLDFVWNFYTGCDHWRSGVCPVGEKCWAKGMAHRFGRSFEPTLHPERLLDPLKRKTPARIGVCFTGDLFGDWVEPLQEIPTQKSVLSPDVWLTRKLRDIVFDVVLDCPQHQFLFLTKAPWNIQKWGKFPGNAWAGASVCNQETLRHGLYTGLNRVDAKHKWLSIEPLMEQLKLDPRDLNGEMLGEDHFIDWVTIGGWSGGKTPPKIEWIEEIVGAADKAGIPVFLKDNLIPLFAVNGNKEHIYFPPWATARGFYRQEQPLSFKPAEGGK